MILARRVEMKTRRRRKRECFYVIILMNSILFARLRFILCVYKWKERKTCAGTEFMSVENVFLSCFCFAYICQLSRALVIILIVEFILFISFERTILDSLTRWAWEGGGGRPAGALEGEHVLVTRHMCVCVCVWESLWKIFHLNLLSWKCEICAIINIIILCFASLIVKMCYELNKPYALLRM